MVQLGTVSHDAVYFADNPVRYGSVQDPTGPDKQARFSVSAGLRRNSTRKRGLAGPACTRDLDGPDGGLAKSKRLHRVEGYQRQTSDPRLVDEFIPVPSGVFFSRVLPQFTRTPKFTTTASLLTEQRISLRLC
jgi:hypothetical protein